MRDDGWLLYLAGALAGPGIGIIASLMAVAGGEPLIPTFVLRRREDFLLLMASRRIR